MLLGFSKVTILWQDRNVSIVVVVAPPFGSVSRGFLFVWCTEVPWTKSETWYDCCVTPFARVTFHVRLRRKPNYYIINLIVPCIIFSVLTLFSLTLQPGCSDRIGLGRFCYN